MVWDIGFFAAGLAWIWFHMDAARRLRERLATHHPEVWAQLPANVRGDYSGFRFTWSSRGDALNDPVVLSLVRRIRLGCYLFVGVWSVVFISNLV